MNAPSIQLPEMAHLPDNKTIRAELIEAVEEEQLIDISSEEYATVRARIINPMLGGTSQRGIIEKIVDDSTNTPFYKLILRDNEENPRIVSSGVRLFRGIGLMAGWMVEGESLYSIVATPRTSRKLPRIVRRLPNPTPIGILRFFSEMTPVSIPENEIDKIINDDRLSYTGTRHNVQWATDSLREWLRNELRKKKIVPLPEAYSSLKKKIIEQFQRNRVPYGENVGTLASQALNGHIMQSNFNSFHRTGAFEAGASGIDRWRQITSATKSPNQKDRHVKIFFKDHVGYEEIMRDKYSTMVEVTIDGLIEKSELRNITTSDGDEPWWYSIYKSIHGDVVTEGYYLRIYLRRSKLYQFNITMNEIRLAIEESSKNIVSCVCGTTSMAILDLYYNQGSIGDTLKKSLTQMDEHMKAIVVLRDQILSGFSKVTLEKHGIEGINTLHPQHIELKQYINDSIHVEGLTHRIIVNNKKMFKDNVVMRDVALFVESVLGNRVDIDGGELIVTLNEGEEDDALRVIDDKKKGWIAALKADSENTTAIRILSSGRKVYAVAPGQVQLKNIAKRQDVDPIRTTSSDGWDILNTLGVEALRSFLVAEYIQISPNIDPRHTELMSDAQVFYGSWQSMNFTSIKESQSGPTMKAMNRFTLDNMIKNALGGVVEKVRNMGTSVMTGRRIPAGTGVISAEAEGTSARSDLERLKRSVFIPGNHEVITHDSTYSSTLRMDDDYHLAGDTYTNTATKFMTGLSPSMTTDDLKDTIEALFTKTSDILHMRSLEEGGIDSAKVSVQHDESLKQFKEMIQNVKLVEQHKASARITFTPPEAIIPSPIPLAPELKLGILRAIIEGTEWNMPIDEEGLQQVMHRGMTQIKFDEMNKSLTSDETKPPVELTREERMRKRLAEQKGRKK